MTDLTAGDVYESIERGVWRSGTFTVTDEHLKLLRRAHVRWNNAEFGAPGISPKGPYGNSQVERDIAEILDEPKWRDAVAEDDRHSDDAAKDYYLSRNRDRIVRLHAETGIVLQIILATGLFEVGEYRMSKTYDFTSWVRATPWPPQ